MATRAAKILKLVLSSKQQNSFGQDCPNEKRLIAYKNEHLIGSEKENNNKLDDNQTEEELFESSGSEYVPDTTDHDETDENSNISLLSPIVAAIPEENKSSFTSNRGIENRNLCKYKLPILKW